LYLSLFQHHGQDIVDADTGLATL